MLQKGETTEHHSSNVFSELFRSNKLFAFFKKKKRISPNFGCKKFPDKTLVVQQGCLVSNIFILLYWYFEGPRTYSSLSIFELIVEFYHYCCNELSSLYNSIPTKLLYIHYILYYYTIFHQTKLDSIINFVDLLLFQSFCIYFHSPIIFISSF